MLVGGQLLLPRSQAQRPKAPGCRSTQRSRPGGGRQPPRQRRGTSPAKRSRRSSQLVTCLSTACLGSWAPCLIGPAASWRPPEGPAGLHGRGRGTTARGTTVSCLQQLFPPAVGARLCPKDPPCTPTPALLTALLCSQLPSEGPGFWGLHVHSSYCGKEFLRNKPAAPPEGWAGPPREEMEAAPALHPTHRPSPASKSHTYRGIYTYQSQDVVKAPQPFGKGMWEMDTRVLDTPRVLCQSCSSQPHRALAFSSASTIPQLGFKRPD